MCRATTTHFGQRTVNYAVLAYPIESQIWNLDDVRRFIKELSYKYSGLLKRWVQPLFIFDYEIFIIYRLKNPHFPFHCQCDLNNAKTTGEQALEKKDFKRPATLRKTFFFVQLFNMAEHRKYEVNYEREETANNLHIEMDSDNREISGISMQHDVALDFRRVGECVVTATISDYLKSVELREWTDKVRLKIAHSAIANECNCCRTISP